MSDQESEIQRLESQFPLVSGHAFATAREKVLASGQSVLQADGGFIYRVFPDGRKERVKKIDPPAPAIPGTKFTIGWTPPRPECECSLDRTAPAKASTEDPQINISRVAHRVKFGGHDVPEDKIASRYHRSLALLMDAIRRTNRAYIFDNSSDNADGKHTWVAEITDGQTLELKSDRTPAWFKRAVLDKIVPSK
jgi:hypothetical protein